MSPSRSRCAAEQEPREAGRPSAELLDPLAQDARRARVIHIDLPWEPQALARRRRQQGKTQAVRTQPKAVP